MSSIAPVVDLNPGAAGSAPADPGAGGSPVSGAELAASLADAEAAALATYTGTPAPAGGDKGDGGKPGPDAATLAKVQAYIDKNYQGDPDAFLHAQYESRAQAKALADRLAEVEAQLKNPPAPARDAAEEFKAARAESPEILAIDQQIQSLDRGIKASQQRMLQIANEAGPFQKSITTLETELAHADDPTDHSKVMTKLLLARQDFDRLNSEYSMVQTKIGTGQFQVGQLQRELAQVERGLRESLNRQANDEVHESQARDADMRVYNAAFAHHVSDFGIDPKSPMFTRLQKSIRLQLADELIGLGNDSPELDAMQIADMVRQLVDQNMTDLGIAKSGTRRSPSTAAPARHPALIRPTPAAVEPGGDATTRKDLAEAMKNPDFVRRRAAALAPVIARSRGGRL